MSGLFGGGNVLVWECMSSSGVGWLFTWQKIINSNILRHVIIGKLTFIWQDIKWKYTEGFIFQQNISSPHIQRFHELAWKEEFDWFKPDWKIVVNKISSKEELMTKFHKERDKLHTLTGTKLLVHIKNQSYKYYFFSKI